MNPSESIGDKYKFYFLERVFYITGFSVITKTYEIVYNMDYGNGDEWTLGKISFDKLKLCDFVEKVDIESLNIKIKESKIKYLK